MSRPDDPQRGDDWFDDLWAEEETAEELRPLRRTQRPTAPPAERGAPGGPRPNFLRIAVVAGLLLALLLGILAAAGVFSGDDEPASQEPTPTVGTTPTTTPPATTAPEEPEEPAVTLPEDVTIREGDTGPTVQALQEALAALEYDVGEPDGTFGPATAAAVRAFQETAGLPADGIAGPKTLAALNSALTGGG